MSTATKEVSAVLRKKIQEYLEYADGLSTSSDIKSLLSLEKYDVLEKVLMNRLTFGTAGLRGQMGPGYAAMNDLVIVQTSQGLAAYLEDIKDEDEKSRGVVIGFDHRHNSQRFAQLAAVSFLLKGFKVYIFSCITPTPFVAFAVRKLDCLAGVMVTASHNPKDDNGYKVYWSNGAQILSPHDKKIQEFILKNLKPWANAFDTSLVAVSPLSYDPLAEVEQSYYDRLTSYCNIQKFASFGTSSLKITFTAMHGVSHSYMKKAFQRLNFEHYVAVKEQMYPDPDFPTVKFPNPEEKNCLDLSIAAADAAGSRLILANDPDADRLAVAEKLSNGKWYIFTGNEVGALLGSWIWRSLDAAKDPRNCCMVSSAVSSKILRSIAEIEGFQFYETLTGFKWMANKAFDCILKGMTFLFAFEEAIGYMCGAEVLDKDGIRAAMQVTQMAAWAYSENKLLYDFLRESYQRYGYHFSCNSYFICHDPDMIVSMFNGLRNFNGVKNEYPQVLDSQFLVVGVRDLTTGFDSLQPDKKAILPYSSSTQMITFYFENGCEATIRTSGTEPKVKYYTEIIAKVPEEEWEYVRTLLHTMVDCMVTHWMQPEKNGFLPRPM